MADHPLPPPPPAPFPPPTPTLWRRNQPRAGELAPPWRLALVTAWGLALLAYLAVWKISEELGIGTWWLGPRSTPQPIVVRLVPFLVIAVFGSLCSFPLRRLPQIALAGAAVLAAIGVPDLWRAVGIAAVELAIAAAVALVAAASFTGRLRAATARVAG